jgi:hypothetical protein
MANTMDRTVAMAVSFFFISILPFLFFFLSVALAVSANTP